MKEKVRNILVNFPTNLGDTILALPALDLLRTNYPQAVISAIVSSYTKDFLVRNTFLNNVIFYDKNWNWKKKLEFYLTLSGEYDLFADFKNTILPLFLRVKLRTPFIRRFPIHTHSKDRYIVLIDHLVENKKAVSKGSFFLKKEEREKWESLGITKAVFIATSSKSEAKVYPYENLREVIGVLLEKMPVVLIGSKEDKGYYQNLDLVSKDIIDLTGKTTLVDVYYLLNKFALLVLCVDSAILHLASYLNLPIVALFGPTSFYRFGPWSDTNIILFNRDLPCRPCQSSSCKIDYECMKGIKPSVVIEAINLLLKKILADSSHNLQKKEVVKR